MEENKMRKCPFCGESARYSDKEMRIECTNNRCGAIVWFIFDVPSDVDEEEYISRENKERWQKRTDDQSIAPRPHGTTMTPKERIELQVLIYKDLAKDNRRLLPAYENKTGWQAENYAATRARVTVYEMVVEKLEEILKDWDDGERKESK